MAGLRPGMARRPWLPGRAAGVAMAIGLFVAACAQAHTVSTAGPTAGATAGAASTADCNSLTTCYTPRQLQVAYGIRPLLDRGINGRGETVVLPELAESRLTRPWSPT